MNNRINRVKELLYNNKKVMENYFFMTVLQVLNSLFYLLIYPYLIRTLGAEGYGLYVFAFAIITYFITFISFGFDMPAVKAIAQNQNSQEVKMNTLSCVFTAKMYLEFISIIIFVVIVIVIPSLRANWVVFSVCFLQTMTNIFFPQWYFQGIQKMNIVTYIQLVCKLLSLPFIFYFVKGTTDVWIYAFIVSLSSVTGALIALFIVRHKENMRIQWKSFNELKIWFKDATPFFASNFASAVKQQSISVIIGSLFKMSDVALYDLGYKIIQIPNIIFANVNGALFPKLANDNRKNVLNKVFRFEAMAGILAVVFVALLGKYIIFFLGGEAMLGAYPIAVILSFGILNFLLVSAYIHFIFVPQYKYNLVLQNQLTAFFLFFILLTIGLSLWKNILSIAIAWSIAALFEIIYCNILIKKHNLFSKL